MIKKINLGLIMVLLALGCSNSHNSRGENRQYIKSVFEDYHQAIREGNGRKAVKFVSDDTIAWYEEGRKLALDQKGSDLLEKGPAKKFTVIMFRNEFTRKELENTDGKTLFIIAINRGWVYREGDTPRLDFIEVSQNGKEAVGHIMDEEKVPIFSFIKENNQWKVSLKIPIHHADLLFRDTIADTAIKERDWLKFLLETSTGKKAKKEIFREWDTNSELKYHEQTFEKDGIR